MGQTAAPTIGRRRQALTNVIGAFVLGRSARSFSTGLERVGSGPGDELAHSITIGTASPGGVYDAYGEGLARMLTRTLQIEATAQVTQGPAQNIVPGKERSHARLRHHGGRLTGL